MGGSSRVANTKSRITQNLANTENRVMETSANTESRVMQDLGGRKLEEVRVATPSKTLAPRWCPRCTTKTKKCRLQKMCQRELAEKMEEE
jgi:hypothetical protein